MNLLKPELWDVLSPGLADLLGQDFDRVAALRQVRLSIRGALLDQAKEKGADTLAP